MLGVYHFRSRIHQYSYISIFYIMNRSNTAVILQWRGTGILLSSKADSHFWRRTEALVQRWDIVSPSCLASADPSFLNCSRATLCQPPMDSATTGIRAMPCWSHCSAVPHHLVVVGQRESIDKLSGCPCPGGVFEGVSHCYV